MTTEHLEVLVEEPSMEACLRALLPKIVGKNVTFEVYPFQCKTELLKNLESRLRGYTKWLPKRWRIVVLVDCDDDDCHELKRNLEQAADKANLISRSKDPSNWKIVNRIVVEELEAWFFGDMEAVRSVYKRIAPTLGKMASYRDPDTIRGGTWESMERVLRRAGYFKSGLRKIEFAQKVSTHLDPNRNRSHSFQVFRDALRDAIGFEAEPPNELFGPDAFQ